MSAPIKSHDHTFALVRVMDARTASYSLDEAAQLAGVHPDMLRYYCQVGVLGQERERDESELLFDDDALYELRRFEHYRRYHGVDRRTLRLICGLWREVARLQTEVRSLRKH